jgi:DNA-binding MarR family transcriptional regulator
MENGLIEILPLGRSLSMMVKSYFGALSKRLEHLDIERHYSILIFIEQANVGCTQQCICDYLRIDKVSMVRILDNLIKKKFVKKTVNPTDRREHVIELTPKAEKALPEIHAAIKSLNKDAYKGLTKEQQKEFYRWISLIQVNLDPLPSQKIYINYKKANKAKK